MKHEYEDLEGGSGELAGNSRMLLKSPVEVFQAVAIILALCYGAGWLIAWSFYREFNLSPEDVGTGQEFLLVRSALIASVLILCFGALLMPTTCGEWLPRGRRGDLLPFHRAFLFAIVGVFVLSSLSIAVVISTFFATTALSLTLITITGTVISCFLLGGFLLRGVGYKVTHPMGPGLDDPINTGPLAGVVCLLLLLAIPILLMAGSLLGGRVKGGNHDPIFNVHTVCAYALSTEIEPESEETEHHRILHGSMLGTGGGFAYIYEKSKNTEETVAVSTQNLMIIDSDDHDDCG